jgi:hypothetical protein
MDFKKCDEIFEALKAMRPEMVKAIFLEWEDWVDEKQGESQLSVKIEAAPKVAAVSEGYLHGSVFSKGEIEELTSLLKRGFNQTEAAKRVRNVFGRGRTLGAYKLRANQLAKKLRGAR